MTYEEAHAVRVPDEQPDEYWAQCAGMATSLRRHLADVDNPNYRSIPTDVRNHLIDGFRTLEQAVWTAFVEAKYRSALRAVDDANHAKGEGQ